MTDELRDLHRKVQWTGWRLWFQRAGRNPLAFYDGWCRECRKPWPCPTAKVLGSVS